MNLRAKYSLMTAGLIGAVVLSVAATVTRSQRGILEAESQERLEALMEGVGRLAQESLDSKDELMLMSYLKYLKGERPELGWAAVTRRNRTTQIGGEAPGLIVLTRTAVEKVPVTYTVKAYPTAGAPAADVSVSSSGLALSVRGNALVNVAEERKPEVTQVNLGFLRQALEAEIDRRLAPMVRRTVAIAALFMGLGALGALYLGKLLTAPLTALTAAVGAVGEGRLDTTVAEDRRDEVGLLERRFNDMTGRIKELMDFREDILHTLTHELNTPLAGLKGYLELWQDRKLPPEAQGEVVETMTAAVMRMEDSLGNALRLFKGPSGLAVVARKLVWIDDLFDEVLALLAPMAGSKRISVHPLPPAASEFVYTDEDLLRQVVTNLVSNALKYTPDGGEIRLGLEADAGEVRFRVADTGCGIKPEDLPLIFTKFYRADDPSRRIPGTGLGLSIAHKAVASMGGRLWVESAVGQGSTFFVAMPKRPPTTAAGKAS